jgi:hypothetical protein
VERRQALLVAGIHLFFSGGVLEQGCERLQRWPFGEPRCRPVKRGSACALCHHIRGPRAVCLQRSRTKLSVFRGKYGVHGRACMRQCDRGVRVGTPTVSHERTDLLYPADPRPHTVHCMSAASEQGAP